MTPFRFIGIAILLACLAGGASAAETAAGPIGGVSPDGGSYIADGTNTTIPVTVVFTDPDGVNPDTLEIRVWRDGAPSALLQWALTTDAYRVTAKGSITVGGPGQSVLVAQLADDLGNVGFARATFTVSPAEPGLPVVSPDTHHDAFRNTTLGSFVLPFHLGSYTSAGITRNVALVYNSEHARPSMTVHADARPDPLTGQNVVAMSLRIENPSTGALIREQFYRKGSFPWQRLSWRTDTGSRTGAYKYHAVVRSHFADGTYKEKRTLVRGLLINEQGSRYGAGWSIAGVQRIHAGASWSDGVVLDEGNGIARFFTKGACAGDCTYVTPAGDFSRLEYRAASATYLRTYPDGSAITFSSRGLMTHVADRFGNTTAYAWVDTQDASPQPVLARIVDPLGHAVTFAYDATGYLRSVTVAGRTRTFTYNANKDLVRIAGPVSLDATYGTNHLLASYNVRYGSTDAGAVWDVAYDGHRKLGAIIAPEVLAGGVMVRPRTRFRSLEAATIVAAGTGTNVGNAAPAIDAATPLYEVQDPGGHFTRVAFDRYGNPVKVVGEAGTTTLTWNADGLPATTGGALDSSSWVWSADGELLQHSIDDRVVYEATYEAGRKRYERVSGTATWFSYGPRGELIRSWTGNPEDHQRTATTYEYNARHELVRITTPNRRRMEWSYDGNPWRSPDFVRMTREDGTVATTRYTYDEWSRLRTILNPLGEVTDRAYDDADRIIRVSDPRWRMTSFEFTGPHQTRVTDSTGKSFESTYNALGWLLSERHPGSELARTYRYDVDGLLTSSTDRRGRTVTRSYDAAHRPYDVTADGATTTFRYPDAYQVVVTNAESTVTTRFISGVGSLDLVRATLGGRRYDIRRFYEPGGTWRDTGFDLQTYVGEALQSTESIRYARDVVSAASPIASRFSLQDFTGRTSSIEYDTSGRPAFVHFANGATQANLFNADGRMTATSFNTAANARLGATFTYDILNRLTGRATPSGNRLWQYSYDDMGQVSSYSAANSIPVDCDPTVQDCSAGTGPRRNERYTYDAVGNRTDRNAVLLAGSNRYSAFDGYKLDYDAEGNVIRKSRLGHDQQFTWNSFGQLASVMTNGITVSYGYDGLGRRVRRSEAAVTRYFVYDGDDLLLETDANGGVLRTYAHWPGTDRPLGVRIGSGSQAPMYYYTLEAPGHVSGLLDPAGGTAAEHHYTPFGEVESADDPTGQPLRFMARELDFASGLYYVRNRWYDPTLARFISEDPIGIAGGINTYAYAGNDPLNHRDPSGLGPDPSCPNCLETVYVTCDHGYDPDCDPWWMAPPFSDWNRDQEWGLTPVRQMHATVQPDVAARRAQIQEAAAARVRENQVRQCQQRYMESGARLVGGTLPVLAAGHTGGSMWNNMHRVPVGASKATTEAMTRAQVNGPAFQRFYLGIGSFLAGVGIGTGINFYACELNEYW